MHVGTNQISFKREHINGKLKSSNCGDETLQYLGDVDFLKMATRQLKTALVVVVFPHNTVIINKENKWDAE